MDKWGEFASQIDGAFGGNASAAGRPGMGAGNVPHAPGIISGQYPGMSPEAHQMYQGMQQAMPPQQGMPPMGAGASPPSPSGSTGQGPMGMPPMAQAQVLDYLMKLMTSRASQGQKSPVSSTGTF